MNPRATTPEAFTYKARAGGRTADQDASYVVALTAALSFPRWTVILCNRRYNGASRPRSTRVKVSSHVRDTPNTPGRASARAQ